MSNRRETNPLAALLAAALGAEATKVEGEESDQPDTEETINDPLEAISKLVEQAEMRGRVAEGMSVYTPAGLMFHFYFDVIQEDEDGVDQDTLVDLMTELGGSDALIKHFMELSSFPDEGPFSRPIFNFELASLQQQAVKIAKGWSGSVSNISAIAVRASQNIESFEKAVEADDDNQLVRDED